MTAAHQQSTLCRAVALAKADQLLTINFLRLTSPSRRDLAVAFGADGSFFVDFSIRVNGSGCLISLVALEVVQNRFHRAGVSKVEQMESELRKLSQAELRQIREWLDDFIEDELEFTSEFENSIQQSERDMAAGKAVRVREPESS